MKRTKYNILGTLAFTVFMAACIAMLMVGFNSAVPAYQ